MREERIHRRIGDVGGVGAVGGRILGAAPPVGEQRIPLDDVELNVEVALGQRLLQIFVHRQRQHLARARGRGLDLDLQLLVRAEAGFLHQLLRRRLVVFDLERRIAAPGMAGLEGAGRRHHQAGEQASFRPSRSMQRLAALRTRMSFQGEPSMRENCHGQTCGSSLRIDDEAALLDFGERVRRRRFDPVDLAGQQRRGARIGLRHRQQQHLVDLGNARLVPVIVVLDQLEPLARREARHLPRAGARGVLRESLPGGLRFGLGVGALRRRQTTSAISPGSP